MNPRRIYRVLVVLATVLTVALGLLAVIRNAPALQWERADAVSALQLADQSAVLAPERRAPRSNVLTPVDPPVAVLIFEAAGLVALLAIATGRFAPSTGRISRRESWLFTWSLRGPPARARVTLAPAS